MQPYQTINHATWAPIDPAAVALTPMQQGMVFETVAQHRPWTNLQQIVCRSEVSFSVAKLQQAWACAQSRHAVLRSRFVIDVPTPHQQVEPSATIPIESLDWSSVADAEAERRLQGWLAHDRSRGIDLAKAPCQRLTVISLSGDRDVLVWTFHHALLDGRSFTLVLEDVFDHYDRGCPHPEVDGGTCGSLPAARPSFVDHVRAVAQRPIEPERAYFRRLLDGVTGPTVLPITIDDPPGPPRPHANAERRLDQAAMDRLSALAAATDTTPFTCLLAAWAVLLGRYARTNDVVFGSTRSGRHLLADSGDMAGCFINTVPTRVDVSPELSVRQLLQAIRADQIAVRPFEQAALVDSTALDRLTGGTSLLTTNVVFERYLMDSQLRSRGGPWLERRFEVLEEGGFPLTLAAYQDAGLRLVIEFDVDRYERPLIEAMLGHLDRLLNEVANASPDQTLATLDMLQPRERQELSGQRPGGSDGPDAAGIEPACFPDLFERAVAEHPDAAAVRVAGADEALSFAELDRRANRVANRLRSLGIGLEDRIALCLPRGFDHIVAQLAVGKAEAAFVPVDPTYPASSIAQMITDSGARALITQSSLAAELSLAEVCGDGCATIELDTDRELASEPETAPERADLEPDHLAYSIYTSGSTGIPKGVLISHRSLTSHSAAFLVDMVDLGPGDRALQFASLSFDTSLEEIMPTLASGACLVLRNDDMAYSLPDFLQATADLGLTVLNLPTAFWHELVRYMDERGAMLPSSVRCVIIGGEKAAASAYRTWCRLAPDVAFINAYGPTECTISSTRYRRDPSVTHRLTGEVPIGVALCNATAYVVDDREDLVPVGVPGELWVGGPCVGRGYHNQPTLTDDRFRPDPFSDRPGARVYRTGDLVRILPSGDLEYFGRLDRQIKVRGFRIEPGQIEAAAERLPGVAQAFVALYPPSGSEGSLVAWLSPTGRGTIDASRTHARLRETLPSHLVPSAVVVVDSLPITAGGKVDRDALPPPPPPSPSPSPDTTDTASEGCADDGGDLDGRATDDGQADTIRQVFAEVLGHRSVPVDSSFFDLGGHSLLALRLIDALEQRTGSRITLPTLHEAPTAERLAAVLARPVEVEPYRYLLPIQTGGTNVPIFGIHVLGINNEYFVSLADALGPDWPVHGLTLGRIGTTDLRDVAEIAAAYAAEIERAAPTGPVVLAAVSLGSVVTLEVARRLTGAGRQVALVALFDARGPGGQPNLATIPRLRLHARLLATARTEYVLPRVRHQLESVRNRIDLASIRWYERRGVAVPERLRLLLADHEHAMEQEAHELEPYFGPIALFRADLEVFDDPAWRRDGMGWSGLAQGSFHKVDIPGAHLSILAEPNVTILAAELARLIGDTVSTTSPSASDTR